MRASGKCVITETSGEADQAFVPHPMPHALVAARRQNASEDFGGVDGVDSDASHS